MDQEIAGSPPAIWAHKILMSPIDMQYCKQEIVRILLCLGGAFWIFFLGCNMHMFAR